MFYSTIDLGNRGLHMLDMRNRGILTQAVAAVDNALWDLLGKIHNLPVYKLLGGFRDKVPIIAIGGYYKAGKGQDQLNDEMMHYKELGLAGVKFKVGRVSVAELRSAIIRVLDDPSYRSAARCIQAAFATAGGAAAAADHLEKLT